MAVEIRAVEAGEFRLATHGDPAATAHAGAVHHERVKAHQGEDAVGFRHVRHRPHHGHGAHGDDFGDGFPREDVLQCVDDHALAAQGTIVGGDEEFRAGGAQFLGQQHSLVAAASEDRDDPSAFGMQLFRRRQNRR